MIVKALQFAQSIIKGEYPNGPFVNETYRTGINGYDQWIDYLKTNQGDNHGHWWNGSVWMECRKHAAWFFRDLPYIEENHDKTISQKLFKIYSKIAQNLDEARYQTYPQLLKLDRIKKARDLEAGSISLLNKLEKSFG